jgi:gluconolactonase
MPHPSPDIIATGLQFPEGPVAMPDGSVLVVEIRRGTLTRVLPDGTAHVVATLGGGPNGAAIGPDGRCYVCNNGGFRFHDVDGHAFPGLIADDYSGGRIEAVDLVTGEHQVLYRECEGIALRGPNDLVFDGMGGFWFTDHGKTMKRTRDRGAVFYARSDGSMIRQAVFPLDGPNGIGLSPDGSRLYVAESFTGRIWEYEIDREIDGEGTVRKSRGALPWSRGRLLISLPGYSIPDSLAIDADGNICVADIPHGGISVVSPGGKLLDRIPMPEVFPTNLCFGGTDLTTAYVTLSSTGRLAAMRWPRPGLALHWLNRR